MAGAILGEAQQITSLRRGSTRGSACLVLGSSAGAPLDGRTAAATTCDVPVDAASRPRGLVLERVGKGDDQARGVRHAQAVPCAVGVAVVYMVPEVLATSRCASALGAARARYLLADVARSRLGAQRGH